MTEQHTEPAPRTAAGRRLFTDNEPMDMYESDGVTWEDVVAIEAEAAEQSVPPLDGLRAELELMESVGWPGTSHEYRRGVQYAISRLSSLVPQPSERSEPAQPADDLEAVHKLATILHQRESAGQQRCGPNSRGCRMRHRMDAASILMEVGPAQPADTALRLLLRRLVDASDADISCHGCNAYRRDQRSADVEHGPGCPIQQARTALAAQPSAEQPGEEERS